MKRIEREARRTITASGGVIVGFLSLHGHYHVSLQMPSGRVRKITVAGSPSALDHTLKAVSKDVKRLIREDTNAAMAQDPLDLG